MRVGFVNTGFARNWALEPQISAVCGAIRTCAFSALVVGLSACQSQQPGVEVRTVEVLVEVPAPCPGTKPDRPLPFVKPNGEGLEALAAALAAKLAEYSAPGKYADKAEAYFESCPPAS